MQELFDKYDRVMFDTLSLNLSKSMITVTESLDNMKATNSPERASVETHSSITDHSSADDMNEDVATSKIGLLTPEIISSDSHHSLHDIERSWDDVIMYTDSPVMLRGADRGISSTCAGIQELTNGYCIVKTQVNQLEVTTIS